MVEYEIDSSIWELYGLSSNPFSTSPLLVSGGIIPISSFYGRSEELGTIKNILRSTGGSRILISGESGVGKTSFVNFVRWQAMGKYFTHYREIAIQPEWTANDFILNTISSFYSTIKLLHLEKKIDKNLLQRLDSIFNYVRSQISGFSASIAGFGGGRTKSTTIGMQTLTYDFLIETFNIFVNEIRTKLGFGEIIVHYNNLEIYDDDDEKKYKLLFNKIRDFIQTPNIHFIFIGDMNIPTIIQSIPRVAQTFSESSITLETFSEKDIKNIIEKRIEILKIDKLKQTFPVEDSVIDILHGIYDGNIRSIFNSLSTAVTMTVKQYPIKLNKNDVIEILNNIAERKFIKKLNNSEKTVLADMLKKSEITNMELSKNLKIKPQNVSKYINRLKELNCIGLKRIDGTQKFYTVNPAVKWLLLKPSNFIRAPTKHDF